jgi:hypothetical protein
VFTEQVKPGGLNFAHLTIGVTIRPLQKLIRNRIRVRVSRLADEVQIDSQAFRFS